MNTPSSHEEPESDREPEDPECLIRAERLFRQGRITTAEGVSLVAERYGPRSIPLLIQTLTATGSGAREAAFEALYAFGDPAFRRLLQTAQEGKGDQRLAAVTYLGEWGDPRAVEALLIALQQDRGDRTRKKVGEITLRAALVALILAIVVLLGGVSGCDCSCGGDCCFGCELSDDIRLRMQAAKSLARIGDLRAVGTLARMTQDKNSEVAKAARNALLDLLTKVGTLQEDQADLLGPDGMAELALLLGKEKDGMAGGILNAFRAVGDSRALSAVEKLARNPSYPMSLRVEARELEPLLKARIAREEIRRTLLRASEPDAVTPSRELLRAAQSQAGAEAPEQLLRAGNLSLQQESAPPLANQYQDEIRSKIGCREDEKA